MTRSRVAFPYSHAHYNGYQMFPGWILDTIGDYNGFRMVLKPWIDTIGVRVPDCEFIGEVSRGSGSVLALVSANLSSDRSSVCVNDFENLWQHCANVYDGGLLPSGRAGSTIVNLTKAETYKIIRPGNAKQATVVILGGICWRKKNKTDERRKLVNHWIRSNLLESEV